MPPSACQCLCLVRYPLVLTTCARPCLAVVLGPHGMADPLRDLHPGDPPRRYRCGRDGQLPVLLRHRPVLRVHALRYGVWRLPVLRRLGELTTTSVALCSQLSGSPAWWCEPWRAHAAVLALRLVFYTWEGIVVYSLEPGLIPVICGARAQPIPACCLESKCLC